MMDDVIRRQDAIDAIYERANRTDFGEAVIVEGRIVDKKPQWIPCSERLPERESPEQFRGWYLTTNAYGSVGLTKYEFESGSFGFVGWGDSRPSDIQIVAWMPLPEPWKGDTDGLDRCQ